MSTTPNSNSSRPAVWELALFLSTGGALAYIWSSSRQTARLQKERIERLEESTKRIERLEESIKHGSRWTADELHREIEQSDTTSNFLRELEILREEVVQVSSHLDRRITRVDRHRVKAIEETKNGLEALVDSIPTLETMTQIQMLAKNFEGLKHYIVWKLDSSDGSDSARSEVSGLTDWQEKMRLRDAKSGSVTPTEASGSGMEETANDELNVSDEATSSDSGRSSSPQPAPTKGDQTYKIYEPSTCELPPHFRAKGETSASERLLAKPSASERLQTLLDDRTENPTSGVITSLDTKSVPQSIEAK